MGYWSTDVFGNDWADEWLFDLSRGVIAAKDVRKPLERVVKHGGTKVPKLNWYRRFMLKRFGFIPGAVELPFDACARALAAAEVVACWAGRPIKEAPKELTRWVEGQEPLPADDFVGLALRAITIVRTSSEMRDRFFGAGLGEEWLEKVADLEARLRE